MQTTLSGFYASVLIYVKPSFQCQFSTQEARFIEEYHQTFNGLSNVKDLALSFYFLHDQSKRATWWGLGWESKRSWKTGSRKLDVIAKKISVTKELNSLEVRVNANRREEDESDVFSWSLTSPEKSRDSLKQMRVSGLSDPEVGTVDYQLFNSLKILCLDLRSLINLSAETDQHLPLSLRVIYFPCYNVDDSQPVYSDFVEEILLVKILRARNFPNLETVGVPRGRWDAKYTEVASTKNKELWEDRREELLELELFTSGRVLLQLLKPREIREWIIRLESRPTHQQLQPF